MAPEPSSEGHVPHPPSRRRLLWQLAGAAAAAAAIAVLFVLPAERGVDLTGFGRATGLVKLAAPPAPQEVKVEAPKTGAPLHHAYGTDFRTDEIDIPLGSGDGPNGELEWKVKMKPGATLVYSWSVSGVTNPEEFYYDLHSQSAPMPKVEVISHEARTGLSGHGALVAPFDGIHGWYLQNQSVGPAVVHIKLAGFYEKMTPADVRKAAEEAAAQTEFGPPKT
jgi:hypothetical protein